MPTLYERCVSRLAEKISAQRQADAGNTIPPETQAATLLDIVLEELSNPTPVMLQQFNYNARQDGPAGGWAGAISKVRA